MPQIKPQFQSSIKIKVVGIGGAGGNIITRMNKGDKMNHVEFIAINTDTQDLHYTSARRKIHIGKNLTQGLGAGMNPEIGFKAAQENREEIFEALKGAELIFITAGLGGGTGTGAAPSVAEIAKEAGALTIAVVTKPFSFEGSQRAKIAEEGMLKLKEKVDAIIIIPNDRIFNIIQKDTPLITAFTEIDDILKQAVRGISDLVTEPGIINVDFADLKTIMRNAGSTIIGIGKAAGENRAINAAKTAINSPLLETSINGSRGVLFSVQGTENMTMMEIQEAARVITENVDPDAKIIFGAFENQKLKKSEIKVVVIATGFDPSFAKSDFEYQPTIFPGELPPEDKSLNIDFEQEKNKLPNALVKTEKTERKKLEPEQIEDDWDIPTFLRKKHK